MKAFETLSFFSLCFMFLFCHNVRSKPTICTDASCEPSMSVLVRFPFRLKTKQPLICSYNDPARTGLFSLSCNNRSQTVINLARPNSPAQNLFTVESIDYDDQSLVVNDPDNCLPKRFLNGDLSGGAFELDEHVNLTFMACPPEIASVLRDIIQVPCLGTHGGDRVVVAAPTAVIDGLSFSRPPGHSSPASAPSPAAAEGCSVMRVVQVPVTVENYYGLARNEVGPMTDLWAGVRLRWQLPICRECERRGGFCRYPSVPGSSIGCSVSLGSDNSSGFPRSAKYGIILAVVIPGILCIIGVASYILGRLRRTYEQRRQLYRVPPHTSEPVVVLMGLDGPTIESFPKIELGESKRLPKLNDNTCPICLSEYQPKETLRTIPECNHYFHADCVDEWLKMNATCPLCRNSPGCSSRVSSSTSVSFSSSSLSSR